MEALAAFLLNAGIKTRTEMVASFFDKPKTLPDINWGAERAEFAKYWREHLEEQRELSQGAFRLEAQRAGLASGGAYLEGMAEIETNLDEIFGRQLSKFEIEQASAKRAWRQKQAMFKASYEEDWGDRIRRIGGYVSGAPLAAYGAQKEEDILGRLQGIYENIPQNYPATEQSNLLNQLLLAVIQNDTTLARELGKSLMGSLSIPLTEIPESPIP